MQFPSADLRRVHSAQNARSPSADDRTLADPVLPSGWRQTSASAKGSREPSLESCEPGRDGDWKAFQTSMLPLALKKPGFIE